MENKSLIKDFEIEKALQLLVGERGNIEKLRKKIANKFFQEIKSLDTLQIYEFIKRKNTDTKTVDNSLVGEILVIDKNGIETKYTIQLFYIRDNSKNFYITKTQILKEEFMLKQENLEFEKQLKEIQDVYTQGDNEPLDSDEIENLIKILRKQLNYINGNITEKEYLNDKEYLNNEIILDRLNEIQNNALNSKTTDILNIVCYLEDMSLYEKIKEKIEDKEINVENCYTNIKKMLEK